MNDRVNSCGLNIIGGGDGQPAITETDKYFTEAALDKAYRFSGIKKTGESPEATEDERICACLEVELQNQPDESGEDKRNNTGPKWNRTGQYSLLGDSGTSGKLTFIKTMRYFIFLVIEVLSGMVSGKHDQDYR